MKKTYILLASCICICLLLSFPGSRLWAQNNSDDTYDRIDTADSNPTSPLSWINVVAYRQNRFVKIDWTTATDVNVKGFEIERSLNGNDWSAVVTDIPAFIRPGISSYEQIDTAFNPKRLIYRIRQEGFDGSYTYSPVRIVSAVSAMDKIIIHPVPVNNNFRTGNVNPR
ncbi:MAG: hypothetical protein Q8941_08495 [Bacteroidota bacterium]|nr:hypothetical protein [Bacteroidota bacterium]